MYRYACMHVCRGLYKPLDKGGDNVGGGGTVGSVVHK